jgi:solute carrier family 25 carnitine/acylcarnitine transporter 20/29
VQCLSTGVSELKVFHCNFFNLSLCSVKVRLQAHACPYSGPWQCFVNILRHEGFRGLYRGISSPLVGGAVETGINYSIFQAVLSQLDFLPEHFAVPVSAATAGFFLSFVVSPVELIKCRMQLGAADKTHSYTGAWDCTKQVLKSEGPKGLLRGLYGTMCREMPGNAVYFETYKAGIERVACIVAF